MVVAKEVGGIGHGLCFSLPAVVGSPFVDSTLIDLLFSLISVVSQYEISSFGEAEGSPAREANRGVLLCVRGFVGCGVEGITMGVPNDVILRCQLLQRIGASILDGDV